MRDEYDLRKYQPNDIDIFIDVGANDGSISKDAREIFPNARIISLEPAKEAFETLKKNNSNYQTNAECYNIALGNGKPLFYKEEASSHFHRFLNDSEKHMLNRDTYTIESKTLVQVFKDYNIDRNSSYIIKSDSQGGEKYMLLEEEALDIVKGSVQIMIEVHIAQTFSHEIWNPWFDKIRDTHDLFFRRDTHEGFIYLPFEGLLPGESGNRQVSFINKNWVNKRKRK